MLKTKVRTIGGAKVITIPKALATMKGLDDGVSMEWTIKGKALVIKPIEDKQSKGDKQP